MPVGVPSRGTWLGSAPARHAPPRAARYTQIFFLLIVGVGSFFLFSYQSEIYTTMAQKEIFSSNSLVNVRPVVATSTLRPEVKVEEESSREREKTEIYAVLGSEEEENEQEDQDQDLPIASTDPGENITVRRLESSEGKASPGPRGLKEDSDVTSEGSSESAIPPASNTSGGGIIWAAQSSKPNKNDKKKAENLTNPLYVPLEENVHTNLISTKFSFVIKVLAVNSYGSLRRLLLSLDETDFGGDRVDLHIYIDHFRIANAVEELRRRRRRLLLQADGSKVNISNADAVLEVEEEEGLSVTDDNTELERSKDDSDGKEDKTADRSVRKKTKRKRKHSATRKLGTDKAAEEEVPPEVPDRVKNYLDFATPADSWGITENKLRDTRRVLRYAEQFEWRFGSKVVHYRSQAAGYQGQWIESWWPASDDEFALIIDDDLELSPLFYRYVRSLISTYYYQEAQFDSSIYGISLQRPQLVPGKNGLPIKLDVRTRLFMYEMVGIWGQVFFPKPWKDFRTWYDTKKNHDQKPLLEGLLTTDWYKEHGEKMFTPWFVKFVHSRGYYSLYTNFLKDRVLSVSHRSESPQTKKYVGCDSDLIGPNSTYDLEIFHMAPVKTIKRYDFCFKEVLVGRFANQSVDFPQVLSSVHEKKVVLMLSTLGVPESLVRNWVCALRKLGVSNYLFFGEDLTLLDDLARRGHASLQFKFNDRLKEDSEKEVEAVLTVLKLGYDVWFARTDMLWAGNPLLQFNTEKSDMIGTADPKLNLFYVKSTQDTIDLWSSFQKQLNKAVVNGSRLLNFETAREAFVQRCESEEKIRVAPLDKVVFLSAEKITALPSGDDVDPEGQVVLFSQLSNSTSREIARKATQLLLWDLDDDLVCTSIIC
ncbi:hypothetical protein R1sor_018423 [Riccia sorocarpa]|uniref:Glycosyltransferase n=1 Tax=Riccia sorocarpa TaxID=122646 RepID=A0ABD3IA38_9MARC